MPPAPLFVGRRRQSLSATLSLCQRGMMLCYVPLVALGGVKLAPRGECGDARFRLLSGKRGRVQLFSDRERLRAFWFLLENAEAKRRTVDFDLTVSKK